MADWVSLVSKIDNSGGYKESEWEFPKGRRNCGETNKECGAREFHEETNYRAGDYDLIENIAPIDETYMGENRVKYKHVYYLGILTNHERIARIDESNPDQSHEIKRIEWLTKEEALAKLRDYQSTKREIIRKIFLLIDRLYSKNPQYHWI